MSDFDVFLSHNSKDKPAVRELARRLAGRSIRVWLDEEQLIPGGNWQPLLEQGIAQSSTGAVLVGKDGLGPWEDEEVQVLLRQAVTSGKRVIPVLLPSAPKKPKLPLFLSNRTWVDLRKGFTDQGMGRLVWGITGTRAGATHATAESRVPNREPEEVETLALTEVMEVQELYMLWSRKDRGTDLGDLVRRARRLRRRYPHNPDIGKLTKLIRSEYRREFRKQITGAAVATSVSALVLVLVLVVLYLLFD